MEQISNALNSTANKMLWSLRLRGFAVTCATSVGNLLRYAKTEWYWRWKEKTFDKRHHIDTSGMIWIDELDVEASDKARGWGYMATGPEWFSILLSKIELDCKGTTFVDFGSGKGRSLLLAAEFPFKQIVGVEFSPALHMAAENNIRTWKSSTQQCTSVESIQADATEYKLPEGPLVLYFYNPFKEDVMQEVLANIRNSLLEAPRPITILYANPTCRALLDEAAFLEIEIDLPGHEPGLLVYRNC